MSTIYYKVFRLHEGKYCSIYGEGATCIDYTPAKEPKLLSPPKWLKDLGLFFTAFRTAEEAEDYVRYLRNFYPEPTLVVFPVTGNLKPLVNPGHRYNLDTHSKYYQLPMDIWRPGTIMLDNLSILSY